MLPFALWDGASSKWITASRRKALGRANPANFVLSSQTPLHTAQAQRLHRRGQDLRGRVHPADPGHPRGGGRGASCSASFSRYGHGCTAKGSWNVIFPAGSLWVGGMKWVLATEGRLPYPRLLQDLSYLALDTSSATGSLGTLCQFSAYKGFYLYLYLYARTTGLPKFLCPYSREIQAGGTGVGALLQPQSLRSMLQLEPCPGELEQSPSTENPNIHTSPPLLPVCECPFHLGNNAGCKAGIPSATSGMSPDVTRVEETILPARTHG